MKNILLVGGAGFIGSHIADRLIDEGHRVVAVDNLLLGKEDNIRHLYTHNFFQFIKSDFADSANVENIFSLGRFDTVFHFAANSDIKCSVNGPSRDWHHTFLTTANILEAMRKHHVPCIIFSSSSAVYGEQSAIHIKEDTGYLFPVSYYGGAKLASEAFISAYCHMNDLHALILRFPNVVGERCTHGVVYDFINKLRLNPRELHILGDGRQSKPYLYITDLIEAVFHLWQRPQETVACYNIGVNSTTPVNKIADIVCTEMGLTGVAYRYSGGSSGWKGDISRFSYDLSKIAATGWKAQYSSDEAVQVAVRRMLRR